LTWRVLQITDCHLVAEGEQLVGVDTQASLEAVLAQACAEHEPHAVLATGDLAHLPTPAVYTRFLRTVRRYCSAPLLCLPGNHDVLAAMQAAALPMTDLEVGAWSMVWLDSHEDDQPGALVSEADRRRTTGALRLAEGQYVLLCTHHPLLSVNSPWPDKDRIQNPQDLLESLAECSAVSGSDGSGASRLRVVVFGHAHQVVEGQVAGVPLFGTPSTCFQFQPQSRTFTMDDRSPGYRWLHLEDDGRFVTEVRRVDSYIINVRLNA